MNVITGDLYTVDEDYVAQGVEPIRVHSSFLSREGFFRNYQHLTATFLCFANRPTISEPNGTEVYYDPAPKNHIAPAIGDHFYGEKKKHWRPLRYNAFHSAHLSLVLGCSFVIL